MKNILIANGLGDYIASDSFMTDEECAKIENVYWCSAHRRFLQEGLPLKELFPNLKNQIVMYDDWGTPETHKKGTKPFRIDYKDHLVTFLGLGISKSWVENELLDIGLPQICDELILGKRSYQGSRIAKLNYKLPEDVFLPENFVLIHPWSDALRTPNRDFDDNDWQGVFGFLEKNNLQGVVVNKSVHYAPTHHRLIDYTNKFTVPEVFAIAQRASYFIGAASFLAVLMPKLLPEERVFIKAKFYWMQNPNNITFKFYHAPYGPDFRCHLDLKWMADCKV